MKRKNNEEDRSSENGLAKSLLERQPLSGNSVLEMRGQGVWRIPISKF